MNEKYVQHVLIETCTLRNLAPQNIFLAFLNCCKEIIAEMSVMFLFTSTINTTEVQNFHCIIDISIDLAVAIIDLDSISNQVELIEDPSKAAFFTADNLKPLLAKTRALIDGLEIRWLMMMLIPS